MKNSKISKIALDFDGVLIDIIPVLLEKINEEYDSDYKKEDVKSWNIFYYEWDIAEKKLYELFGKCIEDLNKIKTIDKYAHLFLFLMKRLYDIDIVTSSIASKQEITDKLLSMRIIKDYYYDKIVKLKPKEDKTNLDYDLFIDDKPSMVDNIKNNQILFLFDQPWNRNIEIRKNIYRIDSFKEIYYKIKRINRND